MSPPTNGAISLAYAPPSMMLGAGAGGLTNPPLLPFDGGFSDEDFLAGDGGLLVGEGADQTLLLLPSCPGTNGGGGGGSSSAQQGLGAALACGVTTAVAAGSAFSFAGRQPAPPGQVSWEVTTAAVAEDCNTYFSPSPPSPALPLVQTTSQRTSIYRGVTRHRWTGRYEAHLWDNTCRKEGQKRKGRQEPETAIAAAWPGERGAVSDRCAGPPGRDGTGRAGFLWSSTGQKRVLGFLTGDPVDGTPPSQERMHPCDGKAMMTTGDHSPTPLAHGVPGFSAEPGLPF